MNSKQFTYLKAQNFEEEFERLSCLLE